MTYRILLRTAAILPLAFSSAAIIDGTDGAKAAYPEKPIKLVIPFRAGGGSDALARTLQAAIEKHKLLPQPLVIVNVDGAGGAVAMRQVRAAKPDGYTFMQIHGSMMALTATRRIDFGPSAYEAVAQTTQSCVYLAVPTAGSVSTFEDLVKAGKANPNKLKAADTIGGITHFVWAQLMEATGAKWGMVQTGGTSKRFASMKGGHTQMAFMSPGWIKRGGNELQGLMWLGPERHPAAPNMKTAKEMGYDITACLNRRFWAPKGTPADRVAFFADVLRKAVATDELKAYHQKRLSNITFKTGAELQKSIDQELAGYMKVAPIVKASMKK